MPTSAIEIKPLTPDDAAAYRTLMLRALEEFPASFGVSHAEVLAQGDAEVTERLRSVLALGASTADGALVGLVELKRMSLIKMRHRAVVGRMYVARALQGAGLGRRLMEAVIEAARATPGVEQLSLVVDNENAAALRLYASLGFERFGVEPREIKVDGRYHDSAHLWLRL